MNTLSYLVSPKSVAVIGASDNPEKIGFQIFSNIIAGGFVGKVTPVNVHGRAILGQTCYKSVLEIPGEVELGVIVIPSAFVKAAVLECIEKKVKSLIIISAGFGEVNDEGKKLEKEIADLCRAKNIALLGPNCLGLINTKAKLNATFAREIPEAGKIALLSQSGAIITSLIDWSKSSHLGFSKIFSVGNQAQLSEAELLEFLYQDTETSVIIAYMERLEVNEKLTETLIKYAKKKPTVVLFGGKSHFGAKAALSHTGSVVSSYLSVKTYLSQAGVIIADGLEDLLLFARSFYNNQSISGKRLAIVTNAGGPSIAAADNIAEMNLEMSHFEVKTEEALSKVLRAESNLKNPVDLLGDADEKSYEEAIKIVAKDKNVDGMVVILTPQSSTKINETAEIIAKYKGEKPLFASFVGGEILASAKKIIEESGHPCFSYPEEAVAGMKVLADYSLKKQTILLPHKENNKIFIQAKKDQILHEFNLPVVRYYRIEHEHELDELAEKVGYPIVLKTADETAHKSDIGGVILNIENKFELKKAFLKIGAPAIIGKMVKTKFEIMLGIKKEEHIGTTVLFGSGGIYSEILNDFSFRIAPVNMEMAEAMISETKIGRILDGARDQRKYDLKKLAEIICAAVKFADNFGNIAEVDFNPIIADAENFHLVDIRVITK